MKKFTNLLLALLCLPLLQACEVGYYYGGPGWHYGGGGWHHGPGWPHHGWPHRPLALTDQGSEDSSSLLARDFGISVASAEKIAGLAQGGNQEKALADMGLRVEDFASLGAFGMPSKESLEKAAAHLGEDVAKVERILAVFLADVKAQVSDIQSGYWQDCVSAARWSTPENSFCTQAWWTGCSPATGATGCAAAH